jgi:Transposase DDE domain
LPDLEPRLQRRYDKLVQEHVAPLQAIAAGLRAVPGLARPFASAQAAWRFWRNPDADLRVLAQPLLDAARAAVPLECLDYALVAIDWSQLHYNNHTSKQDRVELANSNDLGYELLTALLISDGDGQPIAPLCHDLRGASGLHSTRRPYACQPPTKLDRLGPVMSFVHEQGLDKPPVFIIDREADSVEHYRRWDRQGRRFLIRADDNRRVHHEGHSRLLPEVVAELSQRGAFQDAREVLYHGNKARQWVAQTEIVLNRPSKKHGGLISKRGKALRLRLVVTQVRDGSGQVLAQWLLMTNLPMEVSAEQVALWYYWRWRIESYFKLLKGAGLHLEQWQQETALATAKRLTVAGMACVLVWKVARSERPEGKTLREVLVRLSGRQIKRADGFTEPALLAGLYLLFNALEVVEHYNPQELRRLLAEVLQPAPTPPRRRPARPPSPPPRPDDALV